MRILPLRSAAISEINHNLGAVMWKRAKISLGNFESKFLTMLQDMSLKLTIYLSFYPFSIVNDFIIVYLYLPWLLTELKDFETFWKLEHHLVFPDMTSMAKYEGILCGNAALTKQTNVSLRIVDLNVSEKLSLPHFCKN